jgi:hypothetical protein
VTYPEMSQLPFRRRPGKVIAVGLNYRQHASEAGVGVLATARMVSPEIEGIGVLSNPLVAC